MLHAWFLKIILLSYDFFMQLLLDILGKSTNKIFYHVTQKTLFYPNFMFFWIDCSRDDEVLKS